jgi:hypothetical protein
LKDDQKLQYIESVEARVAQLVSQHVWQGIDAAKCRTWMKQFHDRDCALLGASLLDNLIYRSRPQVEALLKTILTGPELNGPDAEHDFSLIEKLRSRVDPGVRLSPVIRLDQSPTKSGTYVLRLLARSLHLNERWMKWPQALSTAPQEVHTVILVDDFCGTGSQFADFVALTKFDAFMQSRPQCRVVYLTAAAHTDGLAKIAENYPQIQVLPAETLSAAQDFFLGDALKRFNGAIDRAELRSSYDQIAVEAGLGGSSVGPLGYEKQALTYAFAHGTPNNSLPIYWYQNERWSSLVDR